MANMGYCRFQNTANDLADCMEHMDQDDDLSRGEAKARRQIIKMAVDIAAWYEHELDD